MRKKVLNVKELAAVLDTYDHDMEVCVRGSTWFMSPCFKVTEHEDHISLDVCDDNNENETNHHIVTAGELSDELKSLKNQGMSVFLRGSNKIAVPCTVVVVGSGDGDCVMLGCHKEFNLEDVVNDLEEHIKNKSKISE